jgi:pimeloyl-ACP methyl ester carboxylesterase
LTNNSGDTSKIYLGFYTISTCKLETTSGFVRHDLGKYDIHQKLSKISCPTFILQGRESVFSVEGAEAIHHELTQIAQ